MREAPVFRVTTSPVGAKLLGRGAATCFLWVGAVPLGLTTLLLPFMFGGLYPGWLVIAQASTFGTSGLVLLGGTGPSRTGGARVVGFALLGLAIAASLSAALSPAPATSFPELLKWLWLGGTGFLALTLANRPRGRELLVGMLLLAVIGEVFWSFYIWWGSRTPTHPQVGTFYAPNQYAGYVLLLAPLLLAVCLSTKSRLTAAGAGIASAFLYLGVALSGSRAGVVSAVISIVAAVVICREAYGRAIARMGFVVVAVVGLGLVMTSPLLFPSSAHTAITGAQGVLGVKGTDPASLVMRLRWDRAAADLGFHHPLTGTGLGTFGAVLLKTGKPSWQWSLFVHNQFLEAFAEGGLLMFVGMVALALAPIGFGAQALWSRREDLEVWRLGSWAAIIGGSAHLVLDHDWSYPAYAAAFVIVAVLAVTPVGEPEDRPAQRAAGWCRPLLACLAGLCLLLAVGSYASGRLIQGRSPTRHSLHLAMVLAPYTSAPYARLADELTASGHPGDMTQAGGALQASIARNRYDPALLWKLGNVDAKLGKLRAARQAYRQAISIVPGSPNAYVLAASFELTVDRQPLLAAAFLDEGITRLRQGGQGESPVPALVGLLGARAQVEEQLAPPSAALSFVEQATAIGPSLPEAWSQLRMVACRAGAADIVAKASGRLVALGGPVPGPCPTP